LNGKDESQYYAQFTKSSTGTMSYYVGASFDGGNSQVGGSVLGEFRINPKWSVQTGVHWSQMEGDNYHTAEQYNQGTGKDFRALYTPYIAQNVELVNIEQNYQLIKIPLMVAYHHEIFPDWALRFALGTEFSVYGQRYINFDYKESRQSLGQGDYNEKVAVKPINDLTLNIGLERSWNRFLFRISPYVTPHFKRTEYTTDDICWGAKGQILFKIR
jgi:hypothetical protein